MTQRRGGTKRSSWLTFRRRLLLVRTLMLGPAGSTDLVDAVQRELRDQGYPGDPQSALKHDLDALKSEYNCQIRFDRRSNKYVLYDLGELALLDLPDECMEALAFLDASFPRGEALPEHANIRALLDRIVLLLPPYRQTEHQGRRGPISLQMTSTPASRIDPAVLATVKRAIERRQELAFEYRSPDPAQPVVLHRVAPYGVFFSQQGHGYLDATALETTPRDNTPQHAAIHYRLDRIVPGSPHILPTMLPPQRIRPRTYQIRYQLVPAVARRRDIAAYFPDTQIIYHEDDSATVTATVTNLWQTRQVLLRYGTACIVLEPPELVELFRQTARGLSEMYLQNE
ncbi:MAG: WYL domain-containing protein [Chloroflexaceae bacterium]|nr:WYL domain-containing protein [Chloroflexaceae bacterium]